MIGIRYFPEELNVENKKIILRLDFNVPLKDKIIQDHTRIKQAIPFLKKLVEKKAKIIIVAHLGRPNGLKNKDLSLIPIYKYLKKNIKTNVYFFMGDIDSNTKEKSSYLRSGEILLLENIRFYDGEEKNEDIFAKKLGCLGEIYINDAFSCSHRKQASIHKITKFIKNCYAGPLLKKELEAINLIIKEKKRPVTCIIGGSKISTKINVINNLIKNVNNIVIVGAMANNFLLHQGVNIGKSLVEENTNEIIDKIYLEARNNKCDIYIPDDFNTAKNLKGPAEYKKKDDIKKEDIILDIGSQTIKQIEKIIDNSNTVLWNGPAGYFENKNFANGTNSIAKKISNNTISKSLISILGGGDTVSAINKFENKLVFTHLSTAGGAFLEYLEGKDLPGLSVLK